MTDPALRARLPAYVWPDQAARLHRLEAALAIAAKDPPALDQGDAADWLEAGLTETPRPGACRAVFHTIAFHYFPDSARRRIEAALAEAGAAAATAQPLAWLRYDLDGPEDGTALLRLTVWPGGKERILAEGHPHCTRMRWLAGKPSKA